MKRKKAASVILSTVLAVSLTVTTFAADAVPGTETVTEESGGTGGESVTPAGDDSKTNQDEVQNQQKAGNNENSQKTSENEAAGDQESDNSNAKKDDKKETETNNKTDAAATQADETEKKEVNTSESWTAEDFTYTNMSQTLNGCDYTRQFVVSGRAIAGFSESGKEKLASNKNLILPSKDTDGTTLVGVADGAFKGQELTSVTFPTGMMVDYDDTVTHVVTRRGNFIIGSDSFSNNKLTNVYLPEGVIAIMSSAFKNNQISSVSIPHTVWWVENSCFAINNLTTVGFPKTCDFQMQIHALAFAQNNIKSVRLPDYTEVVEKKAFYWNPGMEDCPAEAGEKEQSMGGVVYMYTDNPNLANMERIHTIDRTATSQKSWHQKLIVGTAPEAEGAWTSADFTYEGTTITGLSDSGLEKRKTNKNLALPDKNTAGEYITEIASTQNGNGLFATADEGFDYVSFPSHLEKIGDRAFANNGLTGMDSFPQTLKEIGMAAFQQNELTSVILPDSVTTVGGGAFGSNPTIQTIVISKGMTEIAGGTFGCSTADMWMENLTELTIPDNITKIGQNAFAGNNIKKIVIPSSVKEIGKYAFSTKNYLKDACTVELSEGLVTIGDYAFRNKVIDKIEIPSTVTGIKKNTFLKQYSDDTAAVKTKVYVNKMQYSDKKNFPDSDSHVYKLKIDPNDTEWDAYDFTYAESKDVSMDSTALTLYPAHNTDKTVTLAPYLITGLSESGEAKLEVNKHLVIPATDINGRQVTGIGPKAFYKMGIESVTFPSGVMADVESNVKDEVADGITQRGNFIILANAFFGNNLTSLTLPEGVIAIGTNAFNSNASLSYVSIPHTMWRIEKTVFGRCALETVEFPETCDFKLNIDSQAFAVNKIKAVELPKRVEKVDKFAFAMNTGMEAIDASAPVTWGGKKGYGVVYMYADESAKSESFVDHLDSTGTHKSYAQKLITDQKMPEELKPWNANDFTYSEDGATITGLSESGIAKRASKPDMILPDTNPDGVVITGIADSTNGTGGLFATSSEKLNSVVLPANLVSIGKNAFADSGIGDVEFPETLKKIGMSAFRQVNITKIILPDSVASVGNGAFASCFKVEKVKISAGMTEIPSGFLSCSGQTAAEKFTELTIPKGITKIGANAFAGNYLKKLEIPEGVTEIGNYAFAQVQAMKNLEEITLPEGLKSIGKSAFRHVKVKSAILPSTVTVLDKNAFEGSEYTVTLYTSNKEQLSDHDKFVAAGVKHKTVYSNLIGTGWSYDDFTFDGATVTGWSDQGNKTRLENKNLVIPEINPETGEAITKIGDEAFKIPDDEVEQLKDSVTSPNGMQTVKIPDTVTEIGARAFEYNSLSKIGISEVVTTIGESAFHGNQLTELVIPDNVITLGLGAFSENNITSLTLSKNVTVIPQGAFSMNIRLEHVDIPDTVTEIGDMAFAGARLTTLKIPKSVTKIGRKAFHLHHLEEIVIPGNVKEIGESAFEGTFKAIRMKKIVLEEGVESIGKNAFKEGYIESVELPKSLKSLDKTAFTNNAGTNNDHVVLLYTSNPEHLKFEESDVQKIVFRAEWGADCFTFDGNGVLTGLSEKGKELVKQNTDVVIPDETADGKAITEIAADAFAGYGITSVKLPKGLKRIGEKAFVNNKLTTVELPDTMEAIGANAFADNEEVVKLKVPNKEVYDKLKGTEYDNAQLDWKTEEPDPTPDPTPTPNPGTKDEPSNGNNGNTGNNGNNGNNGNGSAAKPSAGKKKGKTQRTGKHAAGNKASQNSRKSAKTGDQSPVMPLAAGAAVSLLAVLAVLKKRRTVK